MTDEDYMRLAIAEAKVATGKGNWPIGCIIVLDGKVIAKGHNLIYSTQNRVAHAEMLALEKGHKKLFRRPGEATLYTTYEPCPMCFGASINSRIGKIVYGVDLNKSGAIHLLEHLPDRYSQAKVDTEFIGGVLAEECKGLYVDGEAKMLESKRKLAKKIGVK